MVAGGRWSLVVAGGGTAGHVMPALSIAEALVERGYSRDSIGFVGSRRGLEATLVPRAKFPLELMPGRGIPRRLSPAVLGAVAGIGWAFVLSVVSLLRHRPRAVVTVGGYAGFPAALAARLCRIPVVVAESNAVAGISNRLASRFAAGCAVAFPGTGLRNEVVTGNPVRPAITAIGEDPNARARAREELGLPADRFTVLAFGGSLGARRINEATTGMCRALSGRSDIAVRHVFGRRDWPGTQRAISEVFGAVGSDISHGEPAQDPVGSDISHGEPAQDPVGSDISHGEPAQDPVGSDISHGEPAQDPVGQAGPPRGHLLYQAVEYEDRMDLALAAADLIVSRAGATTVAEVCAASRAALLVPLPGSPGDHQGANARVLEQGGAAVVLPDGACTGEELAAVITDLATDPARTQCMGRNARALARPGAAQAIAELVERCART